MKLLSRSGSTGAAFLIFAVAFLFLALAMDHVVNFYDEGIILEGAARVNDGAVIHRDFYANYGPAQFYVIAGLFKLFGTSVLVERVWDTLIRAGVVALAFCIVRQVGRPLDGVFAAAMTAVWLGVVGVYGYPVFPAEFFTLLAVLLMTPVFANRLSVASLVGSGVCIGITVLFRYDVGFYAFLGLNAAATTHVLSSKRSVGPLRSLLRVLAPVWLGTAAVVLPVAAAYLVVGALPDFTFDIVTYPARFYARMRSLRFPGIAELSADPVKFGIYLPIAVALASAGTFLFAKPPVAEATAAIPGTRGRGVVIALTILCGLFFLKGWVRVSIEHMMLSIVCALILAVALLAYARPAAPRRGSTALTVTSALALIAAVLPTIAAAHIVAAQVANGLAWMRRPTTWTGTGNGPQLASCKPPAGLQRTACFAIDTDHADAVLYVHDRSRPTDTIFIGVVGYDRLIVNDVLCYFLLGLKPATKWYHFDPGLQTTAAIQNEMIQELRVRKPPFVMAEMHLSDVLEPNESSTSSGVTLLDDFIVANYRPVHTFGNIIVMKSLVP